MEDPVSLWMMTVTLVVAGAALLWIGIKQRAGTLRRNWFVGLRTSETMRDDESWHAAHSATGGFIVAAGVVPFVVGVLLPILRPSDVVATFAILGSLVVTLVLVLVAGARGHRIAKETTPDAEQPH